MLEPSFNRIEVEPNRYLHYVCEGPDDAPFVLYDAGAFGIYSDGWWVKEALKDKFRVCLYDRAGMGASDPMPIGQKPTPKWHVEDMRKLIKALGVSDKVILVGHSMSGLRLHSFANLYSDELRGLVFVDAVSPRRLKDIAGKFLTDQFGLMLKVGAFGAQKGWAEPFTKLASNNFKLDGPMKADKLLSISTPSHHEAARDEVLAVDYDADYLHGDGINKVPVAIFASTLINGMKKEDAEASQRGVGYGWYGSYPFDDHVSILVGKRAEEIASKVTELSQLS